VPDNSAPRRSARTAQDSKGTGTLECKADKKGSRVGRRSRDSLGSLHAPATIVEGDDAARNRVSSRSTSSRSYSR